jgi:hypothetical protein
MELFKDNERLTLEAQAFCLEVGEALGPIYDKYMEKGCKLRELAYLVSSENDILHLCRLIGDSNVK